MHPKSAPFQSAHQMQVAFARKRCLESKILAPLRLGFDLSQHQSACPERCAFRIKWRQPLRDQVRIDKNSAVRVIWQEFTSERRLTRTVWASDNVNVRIHR